MSPNRLRILLLGPGSNPKYVTGRLIGFSVGEALSRLHDVTLVIEAQDEQAVREANAGFHGIEPIQPSWIDHVYGWIFRVVFRKNYGNLFWTIIRSPLSLAFEWRAWRQFRSRIIAGEFDVVLRVLPIAPTHASPFAFFLRKGPVPFVIGPLNGGLPWPKGFKQLDRHLPLAGYWAANVRGLYRFLPFSRSTFAKATAIIAGGSCTWREFAHYRDKLFYVPGENGVSPSLIEDRASRSGGNDILEVTMVQRLVPLKAVDLGLRGAASLLREGRARLNIIGDGPDRQRLEHLVDELGVRSAVVFCGWVTHAETLVRLKKADVLLFPSLREFGGGVVFEALAMGAVPVVADYGGPGDIVTDDVGYRIPLTDERQMVAAIESVLKRLASDRPHLEALRVRGATYTREQLTWDAKAQMISRVLRWAVGTGPRPSLMPPRTTADSTLAS
jgi:glycosyltransferase involved in cell wall biosynthesis